MTEALTLRSRDGLSLEAALDRPKDPSAALVLCHPHPQMGGTMKAPLLLALVEAFVPDGWAVLRFNFRGIGASEGEPSTGEAEVADALGAVDFLEERHPGLPLAIAGWSFGGAVAIRASEETTALGACVGIAPAIKPKPGITAGLPDASGLRSELPRLIICGANDHLVDPKDCEAWAEAANAEVTIMKGANHFFWGKYEDLAETVTGWLDETLGRADPGRGKG